MKHMKRLRLLLPLMIIGMLIFGAVTASAATGTITAMLREAVGLNASAGYELTTDKEVYQKGEAIKVTVKVPADDENAWVGIIKSGKTAADKYGCAPYFWYYANKYHGNGDCTTNFNIFDGEYSGDLNYSEYDKEEQALIDVEAGCLNPGVYDIILFEDDGFEYGAMATVVIDGEYAVKYMNGEDELKNLTPVTYLFSQVQKGTVDLPKNVNVEHYNFKGWYDNADLKGSAVTGIAKGSQGEKTFYGKFEPKKYNVTFDTDGGSSVASQSVTYKTQVKRPAAPTKSGSVFLGWATEKNGKAGFDFNQPIQGPTTLYAVWGSAGSKVVTFDATGGSDVLSQALNAGQKAERPADSAREGYFFGGWFTDKNCSTVFNFGTAVTDNITVYAKWIPIEYQIVFDSYGGTPVEPITYTIETPTFELPKPTRDQYVFDGWGDPFGNVYYKIEQGSTGSLGLGARWESFNSLSTDKTTYMNGEPIMVTVKSVIPGAWVGLYKETDTVEEGVANVYRWDYVDQHYGTAFNIMDAKAINQLTVGKYKIVLVDNNWQVVMQHNIVVEKNTNPAKGTLTVSGYSRDDKTYSGSSSKDRGEKLYDFYYGDGIEVKASVSGIGCDGAWVGILTDAQYSGNQIGEYMKKNWYYVDDFKDQSVNLNYVDNSVISEDAKAIPYGLNYWIILASKENQILDAIPFNYRTFNMDWAGQPWAENVSTSLVVEQDWVSKVADGTKLKPSLTLKQVNGHFGFTKDASGKLVEITEEVLTEGKDYTLVYPAESKEPGTYSVQVVFPSAGAYNYLSTDAKKYGLKDGITYYLKSTEDQHVIEYILNGGTNNKDNPASYAVGTEVILKAPAKAGCCFGGWYTTEDFQKDSRITKIAATDKADFKLYAKWINEENTKYKINYVLDGGSNSLNNPMGYDGDVEVAMNPATKKGYRFDGWFYDAAFTIPADTIPAGTTGDLTIYAKFTKAEKNMFLIETSVKGGSISGNAQAKVGKTVTISYKANKDYALYSVTVDGVSVDISKYPSAYTFENVTADHKIDVVYKLIPAKPVISKIKTGDGRISVSWKSVKRADAYKVYRAVNGGAYKLVKTTTERTYVDSKVTAGKKYAYKIAAVVKETASEKSAAKSIKASKVLQQVTVKSVIERRGKVTVICNQVPGATAYKVYRSADGGKTYKLVSTGKGTIQTSNALPAGQYRYKVAAAANGFVGKASKVKYVTVLAKPTITKVTSKDQSVTVKWKAQKNADKYAVFRSVNGGKSFKKVLVTEKTTATFEYQTAGQKQQYKVRALKGAGYSRMSDAKKVTVKR